jgi:tetratricopeptide (TPR) repeat protein
LKILEKAENLIKWTIEHENSMTCLLEMFKSLQVIKNNESLNLISFLEETIEKRFSNLDFYERERMGLGCLERYIGKIQPYLSDMTLFYDLSLKETEKLIDEFESLLSDSNLEQNYPDYGKILKELGDIYREPEKNEDNLREKCLNILFRVSMLGVKIDTKNRGLWLNLGYAYEQKAEIDKAIDAFNNALNLNNIKNKAVFNNLIDLYDKKARKLIKAGEYEKALEIYENKIINYVKNKRYLQKLSFLYKELNIINRGFETFRQIIESNPKNTAAWYELGTLYKRIKDYNNALEAFNQVLNFDPKNLATFYEIGSIYSICNNYDKAIEAYKRVLKVELREFNVWNFLIFFYNLMGNQDKANDAFNKNLNLYKEFSNPFNQLGYALYDKGMYHEAIELAQISLESNEIDFTMHMHKKENIKNLNLFYKYLAEFKSKIFNPLDVINYEQELKKLIYLFRELIKSARR